MWQGRYLLSAWINVSIYEYFCHRELRGFLPRRWVGAVKILGSEGRWNGGLGECVPHQKLFAGERAPAVSKVKTVVCQVHTSSSWESSITNKTDAPVGQMWRWTAHAPFFPLLTHRLKNPSPQKPKSLLFFNHTLHAPVLKLLGTVISICPPALELSVYLMVFGWSYHSSSLWLPCAHKQTVYFWRAQLAFYVRVAPSVMPYPSI